MPGGLSIVILGDGVSNIAKKENYPSRGIVSKGSTPQEEEIKRLKKELYEV